MFLHAEREEYNTHTEHEEALTRSVEYEAAELYAAEARMCENGWKTAVGGGMDTP